MITLILPGYSERNKSWTEEAAKRLKLDGQIRPIFWDHWTNPEKKFKPKEKARLLAGIGKGKIVNIIAKSVGTLVAAYIIEAIPEQIGKVIFCGIPVNDLSNDEVDLIKRSIKLCGEKIICFQNETDPHGSFDQIKDIGKSISKPRDDHDYPYFEEFQKILGSI